MDFYMEFNGSLQGAAGGWRGHWLLWEPSCLGRWPTFGRGRRGAGHGLSALERLC